MIKKSLPIFLLICFNVLFNNVLSQSSITFCQQGKILLDIFKKEHYQPISTNVQLSQRTYKLFIRGLDPHSLYFMASDTSVLGLCRTIINNDFSVQSCTEFNKITKLYRQRLENADTLISQMLQNPFDFSSHDSISFINTDSAFFSSDIKSRKNRWKKILTYQALLYLFSPDSVNDKPFSKSSKYILSKEPEVRNKIRVREKRIIKRILESPEGFESYVASLFFNAITNSFDPHSSYFSQVDKRNFESSLTRDALSYGFDTEDNTDGTIKISRLVPGGPAWKSNEIHKGDILIQLRWPNGQTVDLSCSDEEELKEILESSGSNQMELTIKKANGLLKTVKLAKEKLEADENLIKSYVLKGPKTIGFISLPGFYTEWENQDVTGCANDMAKEILKLKKENIEGIIIDLRNNGGGSMTEALNLAGIFIDEGPLCLSQDKNKKLTVLKDKNRGTAYDGPLVLMINEFSASASEIMAASLQDYHRAVIIGNPSFGKASGQVILSLDTLAAYGLKTIGNDGFVKITIGKFYRLNGISYQKKGVIPDIYLPSTNDNIYYHEYSLPYALKSDSVMKKVYYNPLPPLPILGLSIKSKYRIASNIRFKQIEKTNDSLTLALENLKSLPLNIELFKKREAKTFQMIQTLGNLANKPSAIFQATNVKFNQQIFTIDSYKKEENDILLKNIQNDIYIEETYQIINDLVNNK
jgi:carboxyl-terminal processing protease